MTIGSLRVLQWSHGGWQPVRGSPKPAVGSELASRACQPQALGTGHALPQLRHQHGGTSQSRNPWAMLGEAQILLHRHNTLWPYFWRWEVFVLAYPLSLPLIRIRHCRSCLGTAAAWKFLQLFRHECIALIAAPAACPRMDLPSNPDSQGQTQRWE